MRPRLALLLALVACTSTGDVSKQSPAASTPATPPTPPPPPTPPTPPTPATPPTPPPTATPATPPPPDAPPTPPTAPTAEPATPWWCTCYARAVADAEEPVTACRPKKTECLALERTIANGSARGIVPQSVTHACREVLAAHPGDKLGTRDAWKPSTKPGAWLSSGTCQIPGPANPEDASPPDDIDEQIGALKWGTPAADVVATLGEPTKKGRITSEEATGYYLQTWSYPDGLTVVMNADSRKGKQKINSITIVAPSTLKTKKGLGIGATRAEVIKQYGSRRAPESELDDKTMFIAGSIYGGLFFTFKNSGDKVTEIFLGAGAE
jgi:hypothetical protein